MGKDAVHQRIIVIKENKPGRFYIYRLGRGLFSKIGFADKESAKMFLVSKGYINSWES